MTKYSKIIQENYDKVIGEIMEAHKRQLGFEDYGHIEAIIIFEDGEIESTWLQSNTDQIVAVFNGEAEEVARVKPFDATEWLESDGESVDDYTKSELEEIKEAFWDMYGPGTREEEERKLQELIEHLEREETLTENEGR